MIPDHNTFELDRRKSRIDLTGALILGVLGFVLLILRMAM